jgi:hypothetical protein
VSIFGKNSLFSPLGGHFGLKNREFHTDFRIVILPRCQNAPNKNLH